MNGITPNLLFLNALCTHADRLRDLLGDQWSAFQARVQALLMNLVQAEDDTQAQLWVDEIIAAGLDSPAAGLVRDFFRQAQASAGQVDRATRSVRMTDPTSGQTRDVALRRAAGDFAKAAAQPLDHADLIDAGQVLAQTLRAVEAHAAALSEAAAGESEPRQPHVLYVNLWIEDKRGRLLPQPAVLIQGASYIFLFAIEPWSREEALASEPFVEPSELQTAPETTVIIELLCPFLEAANAMGYVRHEVTYRQGRGFPPQQFVLKPNAVGRFYLTARLLVNRETIYREVLVLDVERNAR